MKMIVLPLLFAAVGFGLPNAKTSSVCKAVLTFDNYTSADAQSVINPTPSKSFTRQVDLPDPYGQGFRMNNWGVVTQVEKESVFKTNTPPSLVGYGGVSVKIAGPAGMTIIDNAIESFTPEYFWFFCGLNQFTTQVDGFPSVNCGVKVTCHKAGGHSSSQTFHFTGGAQKRPYALQRTDFNGNLLDCTSLSFDSTVSRSDISKTCVAALGKTKGEAKAKALQKVSLADTFVVGLDTFTVSKKFRPGRKTTNCGTQKGAGYYSQ